MVNLGSKALGILDFWRHREKLGHWEKDRRRYPVGWLCEWALACSSSEVLERLDENNWKQQPFNIHMGLSENRVYSQWNSHLIGIMISKTIGFRGTNHFQTHPHTSGIKWVHHHTWLCPLPSSSMLRRHCELTLQGWIGAVLRITLRGLLLQWMGYHCRRQSYFNVILWIQYPEPRQWKEALVAVSMKRVHERYEKNSNTWLWSVDYSRQTGVWWGDEKSSWLSFRERHVETIICRYVLCYIFTILHKVWCRLTLQLRSWHLFSTQMLICEFTSQNYP